MAAVSAPKATAMKLVIAISGKRYAGKTTAAEKITKHMAQYNLSACTMEIGEFLKRQYCILNRLDIDRMLYDRLYKEEHRKALCDYSAKLKTVHGETYWIDKLLLHVEEHEASDVLIISDIRKIREIDRIRAFCARRCDVIVVRIDISDEERERRGWKYDPAIDTRDLETELDNYQCDMLYEGYPTIEVLIKTTLLA
jgi:phosphomevalonate kinase